MSGRSRRMRSSISLARACASARRRRAVEPERQERDEPVVGAQEPQLARLARPSPRGRCAATTRRARRPRPRAPRSSLVSGSRCVCTPAISGTAARIARSTCSAISCASSSDSSPGSLRCSESSVRPSTSTSASCAPRAPAARASAAACARSRSVASSMRLDVDDDVGFGQRALRPPPRPRPPRRAPARPPRPAGRRSRRRRTAARRPAACAGGAARPAARCAAIAARAAASASAGARSISTSTFTLHQPRRGEQHEHADEERRDRVAVRMAGARERAGRRAPATEPARSLPKCSAFDASAALS